jgi:hypothetical protein
MVFVLAGNYEARQHKSSLKYLELFLLHTAFSLDCAREELGYSSKITKYMGKVLFLNFLEEVTLKGKFVPYLASFSNLIHSLELKLCCLCRRGSMVFFLIPEAIELEVNLFPIFLG